MTDQAQIQKLLFALQSDDVDVILEAVDQLAERKVAEAVPQLIALLDHDDFQVRLTVINALGEIADERAVPRLSQIVQAEDGPIWSAASTALLYIGTPAAKAAIEHLRDGDDYFLGAPPPAEAAEEADFDDELDSLTFGDLDLQANKKDDSKPAGKAEPDLAKGDTGTHAPVERPQPIVPPPAPEPQPAAPEPEAAEHARRNSTLTGGSQRSNEEILTEAQQVQFSAYYPREVRPDEWQPLQAYVFKAFAADKVTEDAEKQIGPLNAFRRIIDNARKLIPEGEIITAQPHLPGFQFNPPMATVGFYEDWHDFKFKLRAKTAPLNQAANGLLTFTVNGIIVADIPLSIFVTTDVHQTVPQPSPTQPLYDTVFASYSHRDTLVVEKVEAAAKSFGMTYLRDVVTLRSGQHWSDELLRMIDEATIFQLFWSEPAAQSQYCKQEWEYALQLNRDDQYFIRPVYWTMPMPNPPANLQHLHFAYQPDLVK